MPSASLPLFLRALPKLLPVRNLLYGLVLWWSAAVLAAPALTEIQTATLVSRAGTQEVQLPDVLRPEDFAANGSRVRYRLQVDVPPGPLAEPLGIYVSKVSLAGSLQLNGQYVASCEIGPLEHLRCLHQPYLFIPPPAMWRAGANDIEFEVYADSRQMNGLSRVTVGPAQQLYEGPYRWGRFLQVKLSTGLAWASFCMGLIVLSIAAALRWDRLYGWFGVTAIAIALCNLNYAATSATQWPNLVSWFVFSINLVTAPLLIATVLTFFGRDTPWARRLLIAYMVIGPACVALSGNSRTVVALAYVPSMLAGPLLAVAALRWAWQSRRRADHCMALSFAAVVVFSFVDWFRLTGRTAFEGVYLVNYVIPTTVVVLGATLASQLAAALQAARELQVTLDRRVAERTEALTLANQRLEALSTTDGLTGLANRRSFDDTLAREWQRARRSGQPLALLMIDVDHFKGFNDTYGHLAGDDCLRQIAQVLRGRMQRGGDTVARFGGEEFAIITAIGLDDACAVAERIRDDVARTSIVLEGASTARVSVSIGVSVIVPRASDQAEELIALADAALYDAKHLGRNQVRVKVAEA